MNAGIKRLLQAYLPLGQESFSRIQAGAKSYNLLSTGTAIFTVRHLLQDLFKNRPDCNDLLPRPVNLYISHLPALHWLGNTMTPRGKQCSIPLCMTGADGENAVNNGSLEAVFPSVYV